MKWSPALPEELFLVGSETSKAVLVHAFWMALSEGCLNDKTEALDMCLTYVNEARMAAGQSPIKRETVAKWIAEREAFRVSRSRGESS